MSSSYQNRLVGSVVVVALVVIFLPDLLDGKKEYSEKDPFHVIPKSPNIEKPVIKTQFPENKFDEIIIKKRPQLDTIDESQIVDNVKISQKSTVNRESVAEVSTAKKPTEMSKKTDAKPDMKRTQVKPVLSNKNQNDANKSAWVIQLGTFRNKANVDRQISKLKAAKVVCYSDTVNTSKGTLHKVMVGPHINKEKLQLLLPKLKKLTKLSGRVVKYSPSA